MGFLAIMYTILESIIGSKAYGLALPDSDTDIRGIYVAPTEQVLSIGKLKPQPQIETNNDGIDTVIWEVETFLGHALKCNPNILEVLWSPLVTKTTLLGDILLELRRSFLSKRAIPAYRGYAASQLAKIQKKENERVKHKHAMHLIRLYLAGLSILERHEVLVDVSEYRDKLLGIRHGDDAAIDSAMGWSYELDKAFVALAEKTDLPDEPDYGKVNDYLLLVRKLSWGRHS